MPTIERLKELLDYDPITGIFRWKITSNTGMRIKVGTRAGCICNGYRRIHIDQKPCRASRLAWMLAYGEDPPFWVDHENRKRADDRLINLRPATAKQNARNGGGWGQRKNGLPKGVYPQKKSRQNPFYATIRVDGALIHLGSFPTAESAHGAYIAAARKHFGEFAAHD